jgi:hypothetical protein
LDGVGGLPSKCCYIPSSVLKLTLRKKKKKNNLGCCERHCFDKEREREISASLEVGMNLFPNYCISSITE